jgi:hypothetical protein
LGEIVSKRTVGGRGIVEGDVDPAAIEKAVLMIAGIKVIPDDLTRIVDSGGNGVARAQGIVEGGVGAGAAGIVEEAVVARGVAVIPDDETRGVDADTIVPRVPRGSSSVV